MSAAVPRASAPWHRVARAESAALWQPKHTLLTLGLVLLVTQNPLRAGPWGGPLSNVRDLALLMFFFPLLHWRGRAGRGSLDQALPVDAARYELIRIACGTAGAALTLALAMGVDLLVMGRWYARWGGFPVSYAAALLVAGMACYLFGAAILFRSDRPGRVLIAAFFPLVLGLELLGVRMWMWGSTVTYAPDGSVTGLAPHNPLSLPGAFAWLGTSLAVVAVSVALGRREGSRRTWWRGVARTTAPRPVAASALRVPRAAASPGVVLARQLAVLAPRMAVPMFLALLLAAWSVWRETAGQGTFLNGILPVAAFALAGFFGPVLVWMDERGGRDWDEIHPVHSATRRLLHALAGLVWVQAMVAVVLIGCIAGALAEGSLVSLRYLPAWVLPGVPLAVLGMYALGTTWTMISSRPLLMIIVGWLATGQLLMLFDLMGGGTPQDPPALAPSRAFTAVHYMGTQDEWSLAAALLWIPLFTLIAAAAIHVRATHGAAPAPRPAPA